MVNFFNCGFLTDEKLRLKTLASLSNECGTNMLILKSTIIVYIWGIQNLLQRSLILTSHAAVASFLKLPVCTAAVSASASLFTCSFSMLLQTVHSSRDVVKTHLQLKCLSQCVFNKSMCLRMTDAILSKSLKLCSQSFVSDDATT